MSENGKLTWANTRRRLSHLKPWPRNPRQIKTDQAKRLVESFDTFGQVETIAVGPDGEIYNGHQRLNVLMDKYGADYEVDCRVASRALSEKEREKLTVFLHKGAAGEWDFDILANEFEIDELLNWGFSNEDIGLSNLGGLSDLENYHIKKGFVSIDHIVPGCYAANSWKDGKSNDWEVIKNWKSNPSANTKLTNKMAFELVDVINYWARGWKGFIITTPPPSVSKGEYPAGFLGREVANILNVDFVTIFSDNWRINKKRHGPMESYLNQELPKIVIKPDKPIIIVDDIITSGTTAKLCLEALFGLPVWFFAWIRNYGRSRKNGRQ